MHFWGNVTDFDPFNLVNMARCPIPPEAMDCSFSRDVDQIYSILNA